MCKSQYTIYFKGFFLKITDLTFNSYQKERSIRSDIHTWGSSELKASVNECDCTSSNVEDPCPPFTHTNERKLHFIIIWRTTCYSDNMHYNLNMVNPNRSYSLDYLRQGRDYMRQ